MKLSRYCPPSSGLKSNLIIHPYPTFPGWTRPSLQITFWQLHQSPPVTRAARGSDISLDSLIQHGIGSATAAGAPGDPAVGFGTWIHQLVMVMIIDTTATHQGTAHDDMNPPAVILAEP